MPEHVSDTEWPQWLSRRELMQLLVGAAAALTLDCTRTSESSTDVWAFITALCDRILPAEANLAGAVAAGADGYVRAALSTTPFNRFRPMVERLAIAMDTHARLHFSSPFVSLTSPQQDQILSALADGKLGLPEMPESALFRMLHGLTLEGFACHPSLGGNRDELGWKAMGFASPHRHLMGPGHHH